MWKQFFYKSNLRVRWLFSILLPAYLMAFFIFLKPLEGNVVSYNYTIVSWFFIFTAYVGITLFCCFLLPHLFPKYFIPEKWNLTRFLLWFFTFCFLVITVSYFADLQAQQVNDFRGWTMLYFKSYMTPISVFLAATVLLFFFLYNPQVEPEVKSEIALPQSYNQIVKPVMPQILQVTDAAIKFYDISGKNSLEVKLENLYYITSANNYIEVFYTKKTDNTTEFDCPIVLSKILFRNTLKTIEEDYASVSSLYRCHKAYIVNTQKVTSIKGNTKGYILYFKDIDSEIPVSRHKNEELEKIFSHIF
jgi:DNA-binding LytR/AlgR family response regulator